MNEPLRAPRLYERIQMQNTSKIILGLDPGSHHTGFGVIAFENSKLKYIEHGVLSAPSSLGFLSRIEIIGREVANLVERIKPDTSVVEKIFLGKNADSAFKLGHMRGICLFEALKAKCEVVEYAARSIKKGITGSGASSKEQVQMMLYAALEIRANQALKLDASDALALAFYHARHLEFQKRLKQQTQQSNKLATKEQM